MKDSKNKTYRIAILGILTAIIIIQNFVPFLGNIPIPPLNPTIIQITVIVATFVLGTKEGLIVGGVWGIVRLIKAYTLPATPLDFLLFTNPLISLVPRILIGLSAGLVYQAFRKRNKEKTGMIVGAVAGSLTNTVLVLGFIALLYGSEYSAALEVDPSNLMAALAVVVATNGVAEAIASAILAPIISRALLKVRR
ncbi:ECF transporter S component [Jeotgalibaca ciconiae]|uniref:ECF transporter S component n=1 Tax=Jeotgalibaca ciconiae TaxID=2496265 RepID=A0A3Q9BMI1_9LACT|nr:ECF transporter S component [Jeotgalibaca ciconiae]AZP04385.1 ECF transporter S component [Jeotgalibaca ciconiae]HJB24276.1 ECF transporter S component [Candidatus Jeotgalibaca pullicola]